MTYVTKRCPHCGKAYSVMQPKNIGVYGSPLRRCQFCAKTFIDKDYREIAVSGIRHVDTKKIATGTILLGVFPALFFILGIVLSFQLPLSENKTPLYLALGGAIALLGVVYLCWAEAKGYKNRQQYLQEESQRSEMRLKSLEYASLLKELGYSVPAKYLLSQNTTTTILHHTTDSGGESV